MSSPLGDRVLRLRYGLAGRASGLQAPVRRRRAGTHQRRRGDLKSESAESPNHWPESEPWKLISPSHESSGLAAAGTRMSEGQFKLLGRKPSRTFYANNRWLRRPGPWPGAEAVTASDRDLQARRNRLGRHRWQSR